MSQPLDIIYKNRFGETELQRQRVWQVLTRDFFQRWIDPDATVLDLGAGYCEFINNIDARCKYALDLNQDMQRKANSDVLVLMQDVTDTWALSSGSIDVVFSSNFFEHLKSKDDLVRCLEETFRVIRAGGALLAIGPNIRFCPDVYWDFFDHNLALSDRSLTEVLRTVGFCTEMVVDRFLPFTMSGKLPPSPRLVGWYLRIAFAWRFFGKQFFIVARKP